MQAAETISLADGIVYVQVDREGVHIPLEWVLQRTVSEFLSLLARLEIFSSFNPNRTPTERVKRIAKLLRNNSIGVIVANNLLPDGINIEAPTPDQFDRIINWIVPECQKTLWGEGANEATWQKPIFIVIGTAVSTHQEGLEWPQNTERVKKLWEQGFVRCVCLFQGLQAHDLWGPSACPIRDVLQAPKNPTDKRVQAELIALDQKLRRRLAHGWVKQECPEQPKSKEVGICGHAGCATRRVDGGYAMVPAKLCEVCHGEWYCSRECQKAAWPTHKQFCNEIKWLLKQRKKWTETWSWAVVDFLSE